MKPKKTISDNRKSNLKIEVASKVLVNWPEEMNSFFRSNWIGMILLMVLSFVLYGKTLGFGYLLDDQMVIWENDFTKKGFAGIWEILSKESFSGYFKQQMDLLVGGRYRPLSLITFAIEWQFFPNNPKVGHFNNILLYGLNTLLLFRCIHFIFPNGKNWYLSIPFWTSVLFLVHPLHTEVVANIKGRDEILALTGALFSWYCGFKYLKGEGSKWLIFSFIGFFLALLSKESALPLVAVLPLSYLFFGPKEEGKTLPWKTTFFPLLAATVLYLIIRLKVIGYMFSSGAGTEGADLMNNPFVDMDISSKFATIFYTLGLYIKLLFYPHPLTHDYYPYSIPIMSWSDIGVILSVVLYGIISYFTWKGWKEKTVTGFSLIWFLFTLSIVSNIPFTVGAFMNERFLYIPSVGFCILLSYWCIEGIKNVKVFSQNGWIFGLLVLGIFSTAFSWKTITRVPDWKDKFSLNESALKYSPGSARAHCFYSVAIWEDLYQKEKDEAKKLAYLKDMTKHLDESVRIYPTYGAAWTMKAGVSAEWYKRDKNLAPLLSDFEKTIRAKKKMDFVDQYVPYLMTNGADKIMIRDFCKKIGEFYLNEEKNYNLARKYYEFAYQADPTDMSTVGKLGEIPKIK
jgi:protein O-mannosyl-transferase